MYISRQHRISSDDAFQRACAKGVGELITYGAHGLNATRLPFNTVSRGGQHYLQMHINRVNPQWHDSGEALVIVNIADAHIPGEFLPPEKPTTPMPTVPTWDYVTVHIRGNFSVHDDDDWKMDHIRRLVNSHEKVWRIDTHSHAEKIRRAFHAFVGIELEVVDVAGKAKLHQNLPSQSIQQISNLLSEHDSPEMAELMRSVSIPWAVDRESRVDKAKRNAH